MASTMIDPIVSVIFCEDIRQEVGGKVSLMGCYADTLQFQSLPVKQRIWLFVRVFGRFENGTTFKVMLRFEKKTLIIFEMTAHQLNYIDDNPGSISGRLPIDIEIDRPGVLSVIVSIDDKDYPCAHTLRVLKPLIESQKPPPQRPKQKRSQRPKSKR